jgi:hypothetical protein
MQTASAHCAKRVLLERAPAGAAVSVAGGGMIPSIMGEPRDACLKLH